MIQDLCEEVVLYPFWIWLDSVGSDLLSHHCIFICHGYVWVHMPQCTCWRFEDTCRNWFRSPCGSWESNSFCSSGSVAMPLSAEHQPWLSPSTPICWIFWFWDRVFMCSPCCPGNCCVDQTGFKHRSTYLCLPGIRIKGMHLSRLAQCHILESVKFKYNFEILCNVLIWSTNHTSPANLNQIWLEVKCGSEFWRVGGPVKL